MDNLISAATAEAQRLFASRVARPAKVLDVRRAENWAGEPSLFVRLEFNGELHDSDAKAISDATIELVHWLVEQGHPELYPYIELTTEAEEREAAG
ncbi:MAG: hypothetical protein ACRD01_03380 [Terriglobales bacterium]